MLLARRMIANLARKSGSAKIALQNFPQVPKNLTNPGRSFSPAPVKTSFATYSSERKKSFAVTETSDVTRDQNVSLNQRTSLLTDEFKSTLGNMPIGDKLLIDCTNEDLANWMQRRREHSARAIQIIRDTPEASGRFLIEDFEGFLKLLPVPTRRNLRSFFVSAVKRKILSFAPTLPIITEQKIVATIESSLPKLQAIMTRSTIEGLKWQQDNICSYLDKPLPLDTDRTEPKWNSFFFDDLLKKDELFQEMKISIAAAKPTNPQDMKLLHIVQMSGAGKTHLAISFARKGDAGGIVLRNVEEGHKVLFDTAHKAIRNARLQLEDTNIMQEKLFLEYSKKTLMLISLTALELAEIFFQKANTIFSTKQELHTAFIRFLFNGGRNLLNDMFNRNLKYVSNEAEFRKFAQKYATFAAKENLVIFLDEVHLFEGIMPGQFVHEIAETYNISDAQLLARLHAEKDKNSKLPMPLDDVFKRQTSLLYVLVLAMETFLKIYNLTHITTSTSYSAMRFFNEKSSTRGRLQIRYILYNEDSKERLERFKEVLFETFGREKVEPLFIKHLKQFKALSSRAVYLWNFFNAAPPKNIDPGSLERFFEIWIEGAVKDATDRASYYLTKAKTQAYNTAVVNRVIFQVAIGGKTTELEAEQFEHVIELGLVDIKDMFFVGNKSTDLATDYYLRKAIQEQPFPNIIRAWEIADYNQLAEIKGQHGEYAAMALLRFNEGKKFKELYQIDARDIFAETLNEGIPLNIAELKLPKQIIPVSNDSVDLESISMEGEFFCAPAKFKGYALFPSMHMGPDIVTFLVDDEDQPAAFLIVQCKNHDTKISGGQVLDSAVGVCNQINFYRHPKQIENLKKFKALMPSIPPLPWIRVVMAQNFTNPVITKVNSFNQKYPKYPIVLLPTYSLSVLGIRSKKLLENLGVGALLDNQAERKFIKEYSDSELLSLHPETTL